MMLTAGFLSRCYVSSREGTIVGKVARLLLDGEAGTVRQLAVRTGDWLGRREVFVPTSAVVGVEDLTYVIRLSLPEKQLLGRDKPRGHPAAAGRRVRRDAPAQTAARPGDGGLLGAGEVIGSYVKATDGWAGHVEDILVDIGSWSVSHIVIDTVEFWPCKKVMAPREWLAEIDGLRRVVRVNRTRAEVKACALLDTNASAGLREPAVT